MRNIYCAAGRQVQMLSPFSVTIRLTPVLLSLLQLGCEPNRAGLRFAEIRLDTAAVMGAAGDSAGPGYLSAVTRLNNGSYVIGSLDEAGTLGVYSGTGKLLHRFGRSGRGPGEYGIDLRLAPGAGDSILIADATNRRLTVSDAQGNVGRTVVLPGRVNALFRQQGRFVIQADIRTPSLIGLPVHVLRDDGTRERSFGGSANYASLLDGIRAVAPATGSGLWVAPPNEYRIERYDNEGTLVRTIRPDQHWFERYEALIADPEIRPEPVLTTLYEDSDGLWVTLRVAARDWRRPRVSSTDHRVSLARDIRRYDWYLELLDTTSGALLARTTSKNPFWLSPGDGVLYSASEDSNGVIRIAALRRTFFRRIER